MELGRFEIDSFDLSLIRNIKATIGVPINDMLAAKNACNSVVQAINNGKRVEVKFKTFTKKRSLSQNALAWVLMYKIAWVLKKSETEVYEDMLKEYGVHEFVSIPIEAQNLLSSAHGAVLLGFSERNGKQYADYECIVGSSKYNTEQMTRLIDGIIKACEELGIDTEVENNEG